MRTVTVLLVAVLATLLVLPSCGGEDEAAARAKKVKDLKAELKAHQADHAELAEGWSAVRNAVIPAKQAWAAAKGTDAEASLKDAYEAAKAAATKAQQEEDAWRQRKNQLTDEIVANGG